MEISEHKIELCLSLDYKGYKPSGDLVVSLVIIEKCTCGSCLQREDAGELLYSCVCERCLPHYDTVKQLIGEIRGMKFTDVIPGGILASDHVHQYDNYNAICSRCCRDVSDEVALIVDDTLGEWMMSYCLACASHFFV